MSPPPNPAPGISFLQGGGEMGARMRALDWSATALGPIESWPQSLRSAASFLLPSKAQIVLFWGPDLITLYNDAYRPVFGAKHPWALGRPAREAWSEIWDSQLKRLFDGVLQTGEAFWASDLPFPLERHGYPEETFFEVSYDPVRDESGGVGGIFCIVRETTGRVIGERRLRTLRELGTCAANARTVPDSFSMAAQVLAGNAHDVPFAFFYDGEGRGQGDAPAASTWPLDEVLRTGHPVIIEDVRERAGTLTGGPWPEPPHAAVALPLGEGGKASHLGFLVAGVSPRLRLDAGYLSFLELVARQIGAAAATTLAYEEEKRRAEALASLDRAKTTFFSNVSHEFRTPLTLMLAPLEDGLGDTEHTLPPVQRDRLELARRSARRLQKLVNTLLDFSRIEAGRAQASYVPADLAVLTADLASSFRSATEKAGLCLVVDCPPLAEPVYVDRDMWEKIVLNLLSNAFKFTLEGEIAVTLRPAGERVELTVRDTGTGIPAAELPHVFERFRRIEGARSRTHEGTGIGLALVEELVKLHAGTVRVESTEDAGSTFTVSIPFGRAHLPADRIEATPTLASTALGAEPYVEEALRWLPDPAEPDGHFVLDDALEVTLPPAEAGRARILWADDNADMRNYVRRLLSPHYEVEAVGDGEAALAAARARRPDLLLADVMMPNLDGLSLVRTLRADPDTSTIPVILLSARAGAESRIEGLGAGADDYLYKPFSARELLAHVSARLELGRLQARLDQERTALGDLFAQTPVATAVLRGPSLVVEMANPAYVEIAGGRDVVGKPLLEALPELQGQGLDELLLEVMRSGRAHVARERPVRVHRHGRMDDRYFTFIYAPLRGPAGDVDGALVIANDVTEQVRARDAIRKSGERYRRIFQTAAVGIWEEDFTAVIEALDRVRESGVTDLRRYLEEHPEFVREAAGLIRVVDVNDAAVRMLGARDKAELLASLPHVFVPETERVFVEELVAIAEQRELFASEAVVQTLQGERRDVLLTMALLPPGAAKGNVLVTLMDITERTRAEAAVREADRHKDEFLATLSHELRNPLAPIRNSLQLLRLGGHGNAATTPIHEMMERQVSHLVRLVDDLLEMSRISRGTFELRRERVELAAIIRNAIETSEPLIQAAGHRLRVSIPPTPAWLDGDAVRLAQILSNLLNNAAKYTEPGGWIGVAARVEGGHAIIEVQDNGAGIPAQELTRIFDMFSRGGRSGQSGEGGLGIGLALARRLAEMHGGTVEARSEGPEKGSQFIVRLPVTTPPDLQAGTPHQLSGNVSGQRVLVVDDNRDAGDSLRLILELLGADARIARDGAEALELFATYHPDVVLLDIGMPGMDGYEVARRIRSGFPGRHPAIVALTGWGQDEDRRRTREAGFDHHLVKPVDPAVLQTLLAALASQPRVRQPSPFRSHSRIPEQTI